MPMTDAATARVTFRENSECPAVQYDAGLSVYDESLVDGRFVGRYWSSDGHAVPDHELESALVEKQLLGLEAFHLQVDGQDLDNAWKWSDARAHESTTHSAVTATIRLAHSVRPVTVAIMTRLDGTAFLERWLESQYGRRTRGNGRRVALVRMPVDDGGVSRDASVRRGDLCVRTRLFCLASACSRRHVPVDRFTVCDYAGRREPGDIGLLARLSIFWLTARLASCFSVIWGGQGNRSLTLRVEDDPSREDILRRDRTWATRDCTFAHEL